MPVIGCVIKSIIAERKKPVEDRLDINSTPNITSIEEKEIEVVGKQSTLIIGFEFESSYKPDVGSIKLVGELVYATKDGKEILKLWKKEEKLPDNVDVEVKNFLFKKCLTLGINLAEELQLPPPIAFPVIVPNLPKKDNEQKYIG